MVLSTHSRTHLRRSLWRVGQTPRRALRVTRTVVEKLFDDRLARRGTRPLSAGRVRPAAVRGEGRDSGRQVHVQGHVERKAARGPPALSSGMEQRGWGPCGNYGVRNNAQDVHDSCDMSTHYLNG